MKLEQIHKFSPQDGTAARGGPSMSKASILIVVLMALIIWLLANENDTLHAELQLAAERADQAEQLASHHQADAERLASALTSERTLQEQLRRAQSDLRTMLASHQQQIEELKQENQKLRDWAAEPLPAAARRLRERPAITGADAYHE